MPHFLSQNCSPLLRYIRSLLPDVSINVRAMLIDTERAALMADELDLVVSVMTDSDEWEKMEVLTLIEEEAYILIGENHSWSGKTSVTAAEIAQETMIEYDRGSSDFSPICRRSRRECVCGCQIWRLTWRGSTRATGSVSSDLPMDGGRDPTR